MSKPKRKKPITGDVALMAILHLLETAPRDEQGQVVDKEGVTQAATRIVERVQGGKKFAERQGEYLEVTPSRHFYGEGLALAACQLAARAPRDADGFIREPERLHASIQQVARNLAALPERFGESGYECFAGPKQPLVGPPKPRKNAKTPKQKRPLFTGEGPPDKLGRRRCYEQGKLVKCQPKPEDEKKEKQPKAKAEPKGNAKEPKAAKAPPWSVEEAHAAIEEHLKNPEGVTPEVLTEVATKLSTLTVKGLGELKKKLGVKATGAKAQLAQKIAEQALAKPEAKPTPEPKPKKEPKGKATPLTPEQQEETVLSAMRKLDPQVDEGAGVIARDLRKMMPKELQSQEAFSKLMIGMAEQGKVVLHRHDHVGKLTPKEKSEMIVDPRDGTHYILAAFRMDDKPFDPVPPIDEQGDAGNQANAGGAATGDAATPTPGGQPAPEANSQDPKAQAALTGLANFLQQSLPGKSMQDIMSAIEAGEGSEPWKQLQQDVLANMGKSQSQQPKQPPATKQPKQPKAKKEPGVLSDKAKPMLDKVRALEARAAEVDSTHDEMVSSLKGLNLESMGTDDLKTMAAELGRKVTGATNKKDLVKTIWRVVLERKDSLETAAV